MIKHVAILAVIAGVWFHGNYHGKNTERLVWQKEVQVATKKARDTEKQRQDKVNEAIQSQYEGQRIINDNLISDINRLRNRSARSLSRNTETSCEGANGLELAKEHAEFLTRYGAIAAEQQESLKACYAYADSL